MAEIIKDSFGEYIGMSRREIWHLRNGGLTRDQLRELGGKDKEYLISVSDKNTLWAKPKFEYNGMVDDEANLAILNDLAVYALRSVLPVKYSKSKIGLHLTNEQFIDYILYFRDRASELQSFVERNYAYKDAVNSESSDKYETIMELYSNEMVDFAHEIENESKDLSHPDRFFKKTLARTLTRVAEVEYPRLVKNAFIAGLKDWNNPVIFDDNVTITWVNEEEKTGIKLRKVGYVGRIYDTLEDFRNAVEKSDQGKKEERKKKDNDKIIPPERPAFTELERLNAPAHKIEVEPEEFLKQFSFRGGEFGSWVSQNERKESLVLAGNALADLAYILNIDEKEIASGKLNMAFGARGTGGKHSAAAHYEPILNVINLTRENGAGCIAHEWGHYVDFQILKPLNKGSEKMDWLLYREPFNDLEVLRQTRKNMDKKAEPYLSSWYGDKDKFFENIENCKNLDEYIKFAKSVINDYIAPKSFKSVAGWNKWVERLPARAAKKVYTDFYTTALKFDEKRSKDYWSTNVELFARAFEKYVKCLLDDKDMKNNYLVAFYQHSQLNPYPSNDEIKLFIPYFEQIFKENFKQREIIEIKSETTESEKPVELIREINPATATYQQLTLF